MKHLKLILKSLFSNNACVEAARTRQVKYNIIAIVFALLGVFLAVLPTTVTSFRKNGSDWMNTTYIYNLDTGIYNFTASAKENNVTFTIKEDEKKSRYLEIKNWGNMPKYQQKDTECFTNLPVYVFSHKVGDTENTRVIEVYNLTEVDDSKLTSYVSDILNNLDPFNPSSTEKDRWMEWTKNDDGSKKAKVSRSTSCIFFGKKYIYAYSFKNGTTSAVGSMGGDYQNTTVGKQLTDYFVKNNIEQTFNNWKPFFNEAYINNRWNNSWRSTAIMAGVDAGVLLFMGLMVFILTRGKNNPFRIYSFWDSQKIAYYASFTPSILALAFGFLITNMAMMLYVLAIGIRVMWLSMRTLRYNAPAK